MDSMTPSPPLNRQQRACAVCAENVSAEDFVQNASKMKKAQIAMTPSRERDQIVIDHIAVMLKKEQHQYPLCSDYISVHDEDETSDDHVNERWRRKICEWFYSITEHFGFDREVVSIALHYLDRVIARKTKVSKTPSVLKRDFRQAAVACLYLAIKIHGETEEVDGAPRKLRISAFVKLSRGLFTINTLEVMERSILSDLEWYVNPPTTVAFLASLLRLLPKSWNGKAISANVANSIFELSRFLGELSLCVSSFSFRFKSSEIAYASILCALDALQDTTFKIPDGARIAFLNAMAESTSLKPSTATIREACGMIMDLCPSLFTNHDKEAPDEANAERHSIQFASPEPPTGILSRSSSGSSNGGNTTSPICVIEDMEQNIQDRAPKRPRLCNSWSAAFGTALCWFGM